MRKRLLIVLAIIGAIAVAAFAVPLIQVTSEARTREFVQQRNSDVKRFAVLADEYVRTGNPDRVSEEVDAYHSVYGDGVLIVSTRGFPDRAVGLTRDDPGVADAITRGLRNQGGTELVRLTPWGADSALFVQPVGTGAQVNGVVVLRSATTAARHDISQAWLIIVAGTIAALAAFGAVALGLSRWVLRPLSNLSSAMRDLAGELPVVPGDTTATRTETASAATGPPEIRELSTTFDGLVGTVLRSIESQRRLVADASHQLRNPLAALQFRLDVLESEIPPETLEEYRLISAEAERLHEILDGLLALANAETPETLGRPVSARCTAHAVVADRVDFWSVPIRERGATLRFVDELADPEQQVALSESELSQVLDVLVDNATRHGGEHPDILIRIGDSADGSIDLEVSDDGPGVADEDLAHLTDRFFTRDTESGTGLGLSIVDVIVRAAGGRLAFSRGDRGGLRVDVQVAAAEVTT
ncbi:HAMP domain-containing sensor histidine kinase [Gordonia sp. CPCC 205515]|uniref:sensor histidine kinase n=1 Tax=Gordonia sp. CPCC 205515 TaxID=3140791 RepID=UPI003AF3474D